MSEFKATQGWKLQEDGVIIDDNYNTVADFMVSDLHDLANAKLAEKAPEMLNLLQESIEAIKWYMDNSTSELSEPFFNIGANQIEQIELMIKQATEL